MQKASAHLVAAMWFTNCGRQFRPSHRDGACFNDDIKRLHRALLGLPHDQRSAALTGTP